MQEYKIGFAFVVERVKSFCLSSHQDKMNTIINNTELTGHFGIVDSLNRQFQKHKILQKSSCSVDSIK